MTKIKTFDMPPVDHEAVNDKWPIIELPPEVYNSYDDEKVADLMFQRIESMGIDPKTVVFCGFDGKNVIANHSFGHRNATWAVSASHILENQKDDSRASHSPVRIMSESGGSYPAIGVFDISKLVGGDHPETPTFPMTVIDAERLQTDHDLVYWATKNGESLDQATVALFAFKQ